jgi:hypothetical protein
MPNRSVVGVRPRLGQRRQRASGTVVESNPPDHGRQAFNMHRLRSGACSARAASGGGAEPSGLADLFGEVEPPTTTRASVWLMALPQDGHQQVRITG